MTEDWSFVTLKDSTWKLDYLCIHTCTCMCNQTGDIVYCPAVSLGNTGNHERNKIVKNGKELRVFEYCMK